MKKYFAIFAAVALLGMLAIYFAPIPKKTIPSENSTATALASGGTTQTTQADSTTAENTVTEQQVTSVSGLKNGTFNGSSISTRFGTIQIAITVNDGSITDVSFVKLPDDDTRSYQISSQASTMLESQTIAAQSANIDGVSGATYTSDGYIQSLQSAIDAARS